MTETWGKWPKEDSFSHFADLQSFYFSSEAFLYGSCASFDLGLIVEFITLVMCENYRYFIFSGDLFQTIPVGGGTILLVLARIRACVNGWHWDGKNRSRFLSAFYTRAVAAEQIFPNFCRAQRLSDGIAWLRFSCTSQPYRFMLDVWRIWWGCWLFLAAHDEQDSKNICWKPVVHFRTTCMFVCRAGLSIRQKHSSPCSVQSFPRWA